MSGKPPLTTKLLRCRRAYVTTCDKSAGVPVACPPPFFFLEGQRATPCAHTLAAFLSLPGYKVVNVQPTRVLVQRQSVLHDRRTIEEPALGRPDADREGGRYTPCP